MSSVKYISLTVYEQDTLETGTNHSGLDDTPGDPFVRIAENEDQCSSIKKLRDLGLADVLSINRAGDCWAYLLKNTTKGESVMQANWEEQA